ncbi:aldo/keto reductase [Salipaludibacillus agaradhaerens]|uniref:Aldo/keto reductase n=1 Tax=Salipaludibacillus agaradhaerens TaxID=76935 RepID=A0A9Q4FZA5_SALAG|nr:aldo/keto reductase [Salipaludibacillus agaradhaerens]MCR6096603.1 aldo/keto reductase [Salipaludibacillus agaradhaerens]MCR6113838.1 aldo/keto reductase [Salipaludibacillus agaradhaerens]
MNKTQLGTSDLYVSELGFGCMSLSDDHLSNQSLIDEAIDRGINFFDTADLYQLGFNEESVGKAIKGKRHNIILASKGGNEWGEGIDGWRWNPDKNYLKEALKRSLQRLNVDYLDLYQLHGGTIDDPIDDVIEAFEDLKQEGLIRYYGISSIRPNVIKAFAEKSSIVSVMMQYSLLDRRPEEWFSLFEKYNISVIARGPVAKGLLTDEFERKLSTDGYLDYTETELLQLLPKLKALAEEAGLSMQQLALRYVMDQSPVATAIAGASKPEQLKENVKSTHASPISLDIRQQLHALVKKSTYDNHRL